MLNACGMNAGMHTFVSVHIHMYACMSRVCIINACMYEHSCVGLHNCMYRVCMYDYNYVCVYIYIHVVIYVYIYIRVYAGYSYTYVGLLFCVYICAHSFRLFLYIAPLQIHYSSEAPPPTQHGYYVGVSHRSATGNYEWKTFPRSLYIRGGHSGIRTRDPSDERRRIYQ